MWRQKVRHWCPPEVLLSKLLVNRHSTHMRFCFNFCPHTACCWCLRSAFWWFFFGCMVLLPSFKYQAGVVIPLKKWIHHYCDTEIFFVQDETLRTTYSYLFSKTLHLHNANWLLLVSIIKLHSLLWIGLYIAPIAKHLNQSRCSLLWPQFYGAKTPF